MAGFAVTTEAASRGMISPACCKRTSIQSPWQNGRTAERWVGSCRREILDHVIALDERQFTPPHAGLRELLPRRSNSR